MKLANQITVLLLFFLCPMWLLGQNQTINGRLLLAPDSITIPGIAIILNSEGKEYIQHTNTQGRFSFNIPQGEITIKVVLHDYSTYESKIDHPSKSLEILLRPESNQLDEIVIKANRSTGLTRNATDRLSIQPQKLASVPSILGTPDLIRLLQLMPGVQNSGEANGYLYVRGGDPGHNLMLYGEVPLYGMSHLFGIFPFYNTDHIESVQFDKSGANAKYGERLSATVAAQPTHQFPEQIGVRGNIGLMVSQLSLSVPFSKNVAMIVSARQTYVDQVLTPLLNMRANNSDNEVEEIKYNFTDANFTFIANLSFRHNLTVDAFLSADRFKVVDPNFLLRAALNWSNSIVSPTWTWDITDNTKMKNTIYFSNYQNKLKVEQATIGLEVFSLVRDWGYRGNLEYKLKDILFESGIDYASHTIRPQEISASDIGMDNFGQADNKINAYHLAVFTNMKPRLFKRLYAELGVRLNRYKVLNRQGNGYLHLEPRLSLNYHFENNLSFFVAYVRKNQYLNLITTSSVGFPTDFWIGASEGIPAQSANNFSVGFSKKINKQYELSGSGFYRNMQRVVEYPYSLLQFNEITRISKDLLVGKGKAYGTEFMLQKNEGHLHGWFSYTLSRSDRTLEQINHGNTFPAKFDRRHNLALVALYDLNNKWDFGFTQLFSSGSRFTLPTSWYFINNNPVKEYGSLNNAAMPNYLRTDISGNYYLVKSIKRESCLNFSIYNMFMIDNPIYTILDISTDEEKSEIKVKVRNKMLYSILPSISWRFKF